MCMSGHYRIPVWGGEAARGLRAKGGVTVSHNPLHPQFHLYIASSGISQHEARTRKVKPRFMFTKVASLKERSNHWEAGGPQMEPLIQQLLATNMAYSRLCAPDTHFDL